MEALKYFVIVFGIALTIAGCGSSNQDGSTLLPNALTDQNGNGENAQGAPPSCGVLYQDVESAVPASACVTDSDCAVTAVSNSTDQVYFKFSAATDFDPSAIQAAFDAFYTHCVDLPPNGAIGISCDYAIPDPFGCHNGLCGGVGAAECGLEGLSSYAN